MRSSHWCSVHYSVRLMLAWRRSESLAFAVDLGAEILPNVLYIRTMITKNLWLAQRWSSPFSNVEVTRNLGTIGGMWNQAFLQSSVVFASPKASQIASRTLSSEDGRVQPKTTCGVQAPQVSCKPYFEFAGLHHKSQILTASASWNTKIYAENHNCFFRARPKFLGFLPFS